MSNHDVEGVWTVLSTTPPTSGIAVVPIGNDVAAGAVLAGVDPEGCRYLLIPLLPGEAARTDKRGRGVQLKRQLHDGTHYLAVACLAADLNDVFAQFCRELIATIEHSPSPARDTWRALQDWRALFSDVNTHGLVSEETLTGLVGELLLVERLLNEGAPADLAFWVGPSGQTHDMRSPSHAIEVKASLVREGRIVSISSVDQLREPDGADLVLFHVRLNPDPNGFNLSALSGRARAAGAKAEDLRARIQEYGVSREQMHLYDSKKYTVVETRAYDVATSAFPRIVRESFAGGDVPPGTLRIKYEIDLTNEPPIPLDEVTWGAALKQFAREASDEVDS